MPQSTSKRLRSVPSVICSSRATLDSAACLGVDSTLKDLKSCVRRLQTSLATHAEEMQLLERLYYKGKNQHRSALFWRRLEEVRKYGKRLQEMELSSLLELLRFSFFGTAAIQNPKALKGSWTHYPDAQYLCFVMERLSSCSLLLDKTHTRLSEAYQFFVVCMQSGYFVQLVLTIAAITSRLDMLTADLRGILEDSCRVSVTLLSLLHPNDSPNINVCGAMSSSLRTHIADHARLPSSADHRRASAPPGDILDEDLGAPIGLPMNTSVDNPVAGGEDLGTPISRTDSQPPRSNRAAIPSSSWSRDSSRASTMALDSIESMNREDEARPANTDAQSFTQLPCLSKSPLNHPSSEDGSKTSTTTVTQTTANAPSSFLEPADGTKRKAKDSKLASTEKPKKRKKKKDEIDEIFGF